MIDGSPPLPTPAAGYIGILWKLEKAPIYLGLGLYIISASDNL